MEVLTLDRDAFHTVQRASGEDTVISSLLGDATFPLAAIFAGVDQLEALRSAARHRLRAFQISSHGHFRAHSGVTIGDVVLAPAGAWISIKSSISKPFARSRRIQSP